MTVVRENKKGRHVRGMEDTTRPTRVDRAGKGTRMTSKRYEASYPLSGLVGEHRNLTRILKKDEYSKHYCKVVWHNKGRARGKPEQQQ